MLLSDIPIRWEFAENTFSYLTSAILSLISLNLLISSQFIVGFYKGFESQIKLLKTVKRSGKNRAHFPFWLEMNKDKEERETDLDGVERLNVTSEKFGE
jgi:hypothetical protein